MQASDCLVLLRQEALERGLPLSRLYMAVLRGAFCQEAALPAGDYGPWLLARLPLEALRQGPLEVETESPAGAAGAAVLLTLGDVCAEGRPDTGSIYTPLPVADFMASASLKQALCARFEGLTGPADRFFDGEPVSDAEALELQEALCRLRIIDLSCGSGIFLNSLLRLYQRLGGQTGRDPHGAGFLAAALGGTDIRPDALETWALSAALTLGESCLELPVLSCGCLDSVAGDLLLQLPWTRSVLAEGGFDLVIGNPPYIGEKGNRELFKVLRSSAFGSRCYEGRMDLFYYFLHRGLDILRAGGILCQLTTSYYTTADSARGLRQRLQAEGGVTGLVAFNGQRVFKDAGGHHLILFYQKGQGKGPAHVVCYEGERPLTRYRFEDLSLTPAGGHLRHHAVADRRRLFDAGGHLVTDPSRWDCPWVQALEKAGSHRLKETVRISQGIVSGMDRSDGQGVFVLNPGEGLPGLAPYLVPWYKNSDIGRYRASEATDKRLVYIGNEGELTLHPDVATHFAPFREQLSLRRECAAGRRPWYGLQWPRERSIFEGPKLVVPQRAEENRFAYSPGPWYASADVYFMTTPVPGVSLLALMAYLNSGPVYEWLRHCGKRKGRQLELYATPLGNIPLNAAWLQEEGVLHRLGAALYEAAGLPEGHGRVAQLRDAVDQWLAEALGTGTLAKG